MFAVNPALNNKLKFKACYFIGVQRIETICPSKLCPVLSVSIAFSFKMSPSDVGLAFFNVLEFSRSNHTF